MLQVTILTNQSVLGHLSIGMLPLIFYEDNSRSIVWLLCYAPKVQISYRFSSWRQFGFDKWQELFGCKILNFTPISEHELILIQQIYKLLFIPKTSLQTGD